ncbi:MAG: alpha/beta hydrolase [Candidatus Eisenbacteria bacterium]|uniref:Alpha/beta hydrolase n=1 Tax=Eiseniibacteriota bacterium TaxID=2212470 RepID=A0A849SZ06_UNCEI|nr:alpha/beta hydrolase [Candidatus Eisenbacteria bacterium]
MAVIKGGRLDFLAPHLLRSQFLRPGFVRLSLRLGAAQQMPHWAKLQFLQFGVSHDDLERTLGRITSLESWVDEWEYLGRAHEQGARDALALGRADEAARRFVAASAAYNFAQYVMFLDIRRKRELHDSCVRAYARGAAYFDPPAVPFQFTFRRQPVTGMMRLPHGRRPAPVVVVVNGTNAVKEELHWWSDALVERGLAVITFDGPGLGGTFHRLSMVAEPRPVGVAILDEIERHPELDPGSVGMLGLSLGGYIVIRMAAHDRRIRVVGAVSPPYSADVYWNVTLSSMRRELAALYDMEEGDMSRSIERITLAGALPRLRAPLLVAGGGHDLITPGSEAWRIFEDAHCERQLVYYPRAAHDCFNVLGDLRPRVVNWFADHLKVRPEHAPVAGALDEPWLAGEAVDPDFADALAGEAAPREWRPARDRSADAHWGWPWAPAEDRSPEVTIRQAPARLPAIDSYPPEAPDTPDMLSV